MRNSAPCQAIASISAAAKSNLMLLLQIFQLTLLLRKREKPEFTFLKHLNLQIAIRCCVLQIQTSVIFFYQFSQPRQKKINLNMFDLKLRSIQRKANITFISTISTRITKNESCGSLQSVFS